MMPTKKQMRIISKYFKEDVGMLIKTAESVGILDPYTFLQHAVDAGLSAKGAEVMMFAGNGSPNDVVDSYSKIVSSSESISQMRRTKKWEGVVFDTNLVAKEMRKLLRRKKKLRNGKSQETICSIIY